MASNLIWLQHIGKQTVGWSGCCWPNGNDYLYQLVLAGFVLALQAIEKMAPRPGLEPGTLRLTAECSTIELPRSRLQRGYIDLPRLERKEDYLKLSSLRASSHRCPGHHVWHP